MRNFKKFVPVTAMFALVATTLGLTACGSGNEGGNGGNSSCKKTPFIKDVVILNAPEVNYLYGDTFDEGDFLLQEMYSDGATKNVTSGYQFIRKQESVLVDEENWVYEDKDVELTAPMTRNDTEIYIEYKTTCQGYDLTYNLTQPLNVQDPNSADTVIFTVGTNDKVYFYGDGHVESYGVQWNNEYWQYGTNSGKWSWNGTELVIAMKNYNSNISENPADEYRELYVTKNADGTFTFKYEWAARTEALPGGGFKTYTFGGTVSKSDVKRRLTPSKTYGDQNLKGKYSKQTDHVKG